MMRWFVVFFALVCFCCVASASFFPLVLPEHRLFYPQDINGGSYWFEYLKVDVLDANTIVMDSNILGDLNVGGDLNVFGGLSVVENIFCDDEIHSDNGIWSPYLFSPFVGTGLDMTGEPWALNGVNFEVEENFNVRGDSNFVSVGVSKNGFFDGNVHVKGHVKFPTNSVDANYVMLTNNSTNNPIPSEDGFRVVWRNMGIGLNANNDSLVFEKTDANDPDPDGAIQFVMTGNDGVQEVAAQFRGNGDLNLIGNNLVTTGDINFNNAGFSGYLFGNGSKLTGINMDINGQDVRLNNVSVDGNLGVAGDSNFSNVGVGGISFLKGTYVDGLLRATDGAIDGSLTVDELDVATQTETGILTVIGDSNFNSVGVSGNSFLKETDVDGLLTATDLVVSGSGLIGELDVTNQLQGGTLSVLGDSNVVQLGTTGNIYVNNGKNIYVDANRGIYANGTDTIRFGNTAGQGIFEMGGVGGNESIMSATNNNLVYEWRRSGGDNLQAIALRGNSTNGTYQNYLYLYGHEGITPNSSFARVYVPTEVKLSYRNVDANVRDNNYGTSSLDLGNMNTTIGNYAMIRFLNYSSSTFASSMSADGTYIKSTTMANNSTDLSFGSYDSGDSIIEAMRIKDNGDINAYKNLFVDGSIYGDGSKLTGITSDINGEDVTLNNVEIDGDLNVSGDQNFLNASGSTAFVSRLNIRNDYGNVASAGANDAISMYYTSGGIARLDYNSSVLAVNKTGSGANIFQVWGSATNTDPSFQVRSYDSSIAFQLTTIQNTGRGLISAAGTSPTALSFQSNADVPVDFFVFPVEGETPLVKIYGWRTGLAAKENMDIGVGVVAESTASFTNMKNYWFDSNIYSLSNIHVAGDLNVNGKANIDTNLNVKGDINANDIGITGYYFGDGSKLTGINTDINGEDVTLNNVSIDGNLGVTGDSNFNNIQANRIFGDVNMLGSGGNLTFDESTGYVGIGTSTPSYPLHIRKAGAILTVDNAASGNAGLYLLRTGASEGDVALVNGGGNLYFYNGNGLGNRPMTILGTGNVGIGTIDPASKLDVNGTTRIVSDLNVGGHANIDNNLNVKGDMNAANIGVRGYYFGDGSKLTGITSDINGQDITVNNLVVTNDVNFGDVNTLTWNSLVGRLGVGTKTPQTVLDVNGESTGGYYTGLRIDTDDSTYGPTLVGYTNRDSTNRLFFSGSLIAASDQLIYWGSGSNYWMKYDTAPTPQFQFVSTNIDGAGTNGEIFRVDDGTEDVKFMGKVSIDKDVVPVKALDVNGSTAISGDLNAGGDLNITGKAAFNGLTNYKANTVLVQDLNAIMDINATSITATNYFGDGSKLTGITSTADVNNTDVRLNKLWVSYDVNIERDLNVAGDLNVMGGVKSYLLSSSLLYSRDANSLRWGSIAWGNGNTAFGYYSTSLGYSTTSSGDYSFAGGSSSKAIGTYSFAYGSTCNATETGSIAMGLFNDSNSQGAVAIGTDNLAGNYNAFAIGAVAKATGQNSVAIGSNVSAEGYDSVAIGNSLTVVNDYTVGLGTEVTVEGIKSDGTGKVVCIKSDGALGTCSDAPNAFGVCTCS